MIYIGYYIKKKNKTEYTFFPSAHGTVPRTDHIQGHKMILNKFKNTENISAIFSDHNGMKLETHHRKEIRKKYKYLNKLRNKHFL